MPPHMTQVTLHALQGNKVEWKKELRHRGRRGLRENETAPPCCHAL